MAEKNSKSCDWEMEKGKGGRGAVQVMTLEVYEKESTKAWSVEAWKAWAGKLRRGAALLAALLGIGMSEYLHRSLSCGTVRTVFESQTTQISCGEVRTGSGRQSWQSGSYSCASE